MDSVETERFTPASDFLGEPGIPRADSDGGLQEATPLAPPRPKGKGKSKCSKAKSSNTHIAQGAKRKKLNTARDSSSYTPKPGTSAQFEDDGASSDDSQPFTCHERAPSGPAHPPLQERNLETSDLLRHLISSVDSLHQSRQDAPPPTSGIRYQEPHPVFPRTSPHREHPTGPQAPRTVPHPLLLDSSDALAYLASTIHTLQERQSPRLRHPPTHPHPFHYTPPHYDHASAPPPHLSALSQD